VKTTFTNFQSALPVSRSSVKNLVSAILEFLNIQTDEVVVHFVDKEKICELHKEFFNDPTPTDCISFPIDSPFETHSGNSILGEIFICPEAAIEYARGKSIDPYAETTLYVIHGLLHLAGYDDLETDDRKEMRKAEKRCLHALRKNGILLSRPKK
jgi:probable rRNA maturation factor